jgi:hypothetical protein
VPHARRAGLTRAADTAIVPFQQDSRRAAARECTTHSFVGVDYPLDTAQQRDPQAPRREALLRGAGTLAFESQPVGRRRKLKFQVALTNTDRSQPPTGFAFARQMWLEVQALAPAARSSSRRQAREGSTDLCDTATMEDELKKDVIGCDAATRNLVNIQLKLVDRIAVLPDAKGQPSKDERGEYIVVGGKDARENRAPTSRGRPSGAKAARHEGSPRSAPSAREAGVLVCGCAQQIRCARERCAPGPTHVPEHPALLRARARCDQAPDDSVKVGPLVDRLQVVEMGSLKGTF